MKYKKYKIERKADKKIRSRKFIKLLLILGFFGFVLYTAFQLFFQKPQLENLDALAKIPVQKEITLKLKGASNVKLVSVKLLQGEKEFILYEGKPSKDGKVYLSISPKKMGIEDGKGQVLVSLRYGLFGRKTYRVDTFIDTQPPKIEPLNYTEYVVQGGAGAVKVRVKDGTQAFLYVGSDRYPMYRLEKGYFFTLFPVRVDQDPSTPIKVVAYDDVGNTSELLLKTKIAKVNFRIDKIQLTEEFIDKVIIPLLGKHLPPKEAFKEVNEMWRKRDVEKLKEIGSMSEGKKFWQGNFLQLPNSKVISTFGDIRYYYYQGEEVSTSRHMGYDFASTERAPIPASNDGIVVFTGSLGIYGNAIIIDHGFGLMSLYGHLSEIRVKRGELVKKGEIIGNTGNTGLALGDHLHFGVLVHGIEVNPKEWLDARWIKTRIERVLDAQ